MRGQSVGFGARILPSSVTSTDPRKYLISSESSLFSKCDQLYGIDHSCFFSIRRRHTRLTCDWSSDVCSSDLRAGADAGTSLVLRVVISGNQIDAVLEIGRASRRECVLVLVVGVRIKIKEM